MRKWIILTFCIGIFGFFGWTYMIYLKLDTEKEGQSIILYDKNGKLLAKVGSKDGYTLPYTGSLDIPLIRAIIDAEDKRFFFHHGVDMVAKVSSIWTNIQAHETLRGGSTLTEQYIKNRYFPSERRTLWQKLTEAVYASILEIQSGKEEILQKYLDGIYMGNGIYGANTAIEQYFQKSPKDLREEEILEILTRIHSPNLGEASLSYSKKIGSRIFGKDMGDITFPKRERFRSYNLYPLLTERVKSEVKKYCLGEKNRLGDMTLFIPKEICGSTTIILQLSIDGDLMDYSQDTLESILSPLEKKDVTHGAIYIYSQKDKKILAYIGNRKKQVEANMIDMIQERRSVGSLLKPFVYRIIFEKGASPDSLILDDTRIYPTNFEGKTFFPENYVPKAYGPIPLRESLGNSLNSATVRLSEMIGVGNIYDTFRTEGMDLDHDSGYYGYGISLGSVELTLENIVEAYSHLTFLDTGANFLLFNTLKDEKNRARTFGASSILNTTIPLAVKTGTSTDFKDNWTLGYTQDIVIGVWVGNADNKSMDDISGVTGAGPIFHHIAEYMIKRGYISYDIPTPPRGIEKKELCQDVLCYQKVISYTQSGFSLRSRVKDALYYQEDFVTNMTEEEMKKWKILH